MGATPAQQMSSVEKVVQQLQEGWKVNAAEKALDVRTVVVKKSVV
jgi:hypothetical protein